jgi:hypothetical protein
MVLGGLLMMASAFVSLRPTAAAILFGSIIAVMVGVPIVYSYVLWRREQRGDQSSL